MIIQYLRDKKGARIGVLVGTQVGVGWSKVHKSKDKFNRDLGITIAKGRANSVCQMVGVPTAVTKELPKFFDRCNRYFKK